MSASAKTEQNPTIERFLARHPSLRPAAVLSLRCAEAVRAARAEALPVVPRAPSAPDRALYDRARRRLDDAVRALEDGARSGSSPATRVEAVVREVTSAAIAVKLESHAFRPARESTSPEARSRLFQALSEWGAAFEELDRQALELHVRRIPWQLELATHIAPATPVRSMEIHGYDLPRTRAALKQWGDRCFLSGSGFAVDSHRRETLRYRSLDACFCVLTPEYYELFQRIRRALEALRTEHADAVREIASTLPELYDDFVAETWNPTFGKLGLLDYPSLAVSLNNILRTYADRPLFGVRGERGDFRSLGVADRVAVALGADGGNSGYVWSTYDEARLLALRLAYGFEVLGLSRGDRLGIVSTRNTPEFYYADFAAIFSGLVSVGIQDTLSDDELRAVAARARLTAVVTDGASLPRFLDSALLRECPSLATLVVFDRGDGVSPRVSAVTEGGAPRIVELAELVSETVELPSEWTSASGVGPSTAVIYGDADGHRDAAATGVPENRDDVYTITYTSGSTGAPKGTIVTCRRWAEEMCFDSNIWPNVAASFQPSALATDRALVWRGLYSGGRVGFARRGAALFRDIRAIRPTSLDAPPVVWNALYREYKRVIADPNLSRAEVAKVRRRFRNWLGGRLSFVAVGGGPSDAGMRRAMGSLFGTRMVDGYGTTETGSIAVDGRLVPSLDFRLVAVPELGFSPDDVPLPRGELAVKTERTTASYLDDAAETRANFTADGYFLTGDIVEIGPARQCRILGRRKQFFKLAGAEFVSPEALEQHFLASEGVEAVWISPSPTRDSVVAVVVPSTESCDAAELLAGFRSIARRESLRSEEIPMAVVIEPRRGESLPWTVENGLLTSSSKLNRARLAARYEEAIQVACATVARERPPEPHERDRVAGAVAARTRTLEQILAAALSLSPSEVDPEMSFLEHGGDSMASTDFTLRLEHVFAGKGRPRTWLDDPGWLVNTPLVEVARRIASEESSSETIAPEVGSDPVSVPEERPVVEAVAQEGAREAPSPTDPTSLVNRDAQSAPLPEAMPPPATGSGVFLTGATGFLGLHLLAELASSAADGSRIYALVRADDDGSARRRLAEAGRAAELELPPIDTLADERGSPIVAVAGTLDADRLGLSAAAYTRVAEDVGSIYHVAAAVSFDQEYDALRGPNVLGTRRVLELALDRRLKALHFVSSLNVSLLLQRVAPTAVAEDSPLPPRLSTEIVAAESGYAVSKWVCERMIQQLFEHGRGRFRASVSRPALISWSGTTGVADESSWLTRILRSCLDVRCAIGPSDVGVPIWVPETPVSARGLDLVPVNFVARATKRLGEMTRRGEEWPGDNRASGRVPTVHISNVAPDETGHVSIRRLMDLLVAADLPYSQGRGPMRFVPFSEWSFRVQEAAAPALPVLRQLRTASVQVRRTDARRFAAAMAAAPSSGIECPAVDVALVQALVRREHERVS